MAHLVATLALAVFSQQITPNNVANLEVAWVYHHGENPSVRPTNRLSFGATPVYAEGKLFIITPKGNAIALDPTTGKQLWKVDRNVGAHRSWGAA